MLGRWSAEYVSFNNSASRKPGSVGTHGDSKDGSHSVEVVCMSPHLHNLRQDRSLCPIHSKHIRQLLQIDRRRFSNTKDRVSQPSHTEASELFVKEPDSELGGEEGNVFDDGLTDSPLFILGELHDGGEEGVRKFVDTNDCTSRHMSFFSHSRLRR